MKFSFRKNQLIRIIIYLCKILFIIFLLLYCNSYRHDNSIYGYIYILGIALIYALFISIKNCFLYLKFMIIHSNEQIRVFENDINRANFKYNYCYLTSKYIFNCNNFQYIKYEDILCIDTKKMKEHGRIKTLNPGRKIIIYLKNGKTKTIISYLNNYDEFISKIKKQNQNIYIGNIDDCIRLSNIKNKTRI